MTAPRDALDSPEFFDLMQAYRNAGYTDAPAAHAAFEAMQIWLRENFRNTTADKQPQSRD